MKKRFMFFLLLVPILSFAEFNVKKIDNALAGIKSANKEVKFYNGDKSLLLKLEESSTLKFTTLKNADILLFPNAENQSKALVLQSYQQLKDNKNSIGAIYLKKGRTQIVFVKERLEAKGFKATKAIDKYLITEHHFNSQSFLQID